MAIRVLLFLALLIASSSCVFKDSEASSVQSLSQPEQSVPGVASLPSPITSQSANELAEQIDNAIDSSQFAAATWGIVVMSPGDGRVIYARKAEEPFTPASNMKLFTTAAALDLLGSEYRWHTSVYSDSEPDDAGTIKGDLILYGRGAPDLGSGIRRGTLNSLAALADQLHRRGVRHIRGNVIGDESFFRGNAHGEGWLWNDLQWYYGAEVSALSINGNELRLAINPAQKAGERALVKVESNSSYFDLTNDTNTTERGKAMTLGVTRGLSSNNVRVWGEFPIGVRELTVRLAVHEPARWAAALFREALEARGIKVDGDVRVRDARVPPSEKFDVEKAVELAAVSSRSLRDAARQINKESLNLDSELLLRTIGRELGHTAPDPDPVKMRVRGDDKAGEAVIRRWLGQKGIIARSTAMLDGSGLSRLNKVTPAAIAKLLVVMGSAPSSKDFRESLSISGRDGTLASRLRALSGRVLAKTGTLTYTSALSGYVISADGEELAFAILCNDASMESRTTPVIDQITSILASYRESR